MIYNIDFDMCAVIIYLFTIYCVVYKKGIMKSQNKLFIMMLINGVIVSVADIAGSIGNSYVDSYSVFFRDIFNYLYLVLHNFMPLMFCIYVIMVSGVSLRKKKKPFYLILVPYAVVVVVIALNPIFHWVFYYDENQLYTHNYMMWVLYGVAALYITISLHYIARYRKAIQKQKVTTLVLFILCGVTSIVVQYFNTTLLIELFFQALAFLGILFTTENRDEITNGVTHVYNRRAFISDNINAIESNTGYCVISIKFTNIRYYTNSLGVIRINEIIRDIAMFLDSINKAVNVYDCDNGVFAMMIFSNNRGKVNQVINQLTQHFLKDWQYKDMNIALNTQICAVDVPEQADTLEKLLLLIDNDYIIVENRLSVMSNDDMKYMQREIEIEKAIRRALERKSFKVFYQPIWDKKTNTIHSAEALIRLVDDDIGSIPPDEFIPVSEKNGTIAKIGEFVFEEVCRLYSEKHIENLGIEFVEVNLSTVQCMERNLALSFSDILKKYDISASRINLEVTESAAANSPEMFMMTMDKLKKIGFTFSMDDYGTGYSNYTYMFDFDFKIIKLDKSILWNAEKNTNAHIILKNTILMLKEMNFNIVMEGVETEEQKNYVSELGCDYCQGFYFSRPVEEDRFIEYCKEYNNIKNDIDIAVKVQ